MIICLSIQPLCLWSFRLLIEINCNVCSHDKSEEKTYFVRYSCLRSVRDDGIYEFECPEGHRSITVLRTPKHEVLFAIASNALLDGYLRESIASFAASLERFYEFVIRVINPVHLETWSFSSRRFKLSCRSKRYPISIQC